MCNAKNADFGCTWEIIFKTNIPSNVRVGQYTSHSTASILIAWLYLEFYVSESSVKPLRK